VSKINHSPQITSNIKNHSQSSHQNIKIHSKKISKINNKSYSFPRKCNKHFYLLRKIKKIVEKLFHRKKINAETHQTGGEDLNLFDSFSSFCENFKTEKVFKCFSFFSSVYMGIDRDVFARNFYKA
jgi:hypothetical protein